MSKKNYDNLMELLGGKDYRRIEIEGYMPLSVEKVGEDLISLCHYGEMNGDLMADPECVFLVSDGKAKPIYFKNAYVGFEYATVPDVFGDVPVRPRLQQELDSFAALWLHNLRDQGICERA